MVSTREMSIASTSSEDAGSLDITDIASTDEASCEVQPNPSPPPSRAPPGTLLIMHTAQPLEHTHLHDECASAATFGVLSSSECDGSHTCFPFEGLNGRILKLCHDTQHVPVQVGITIN